MTKQKIRKDDLGVSPVIGVILMVAITVVLAGVLWAVITVDPPEPPGERISIVVREKADFWLMEIVATSSRSSVLDETQFQLVTELGVREYELSILDANPPAFELGESKIFALTKNPTAVQDNSTDQVIDSGSEFADYSGCYLVYIDQDMNNKISAGDSIIIYKDYNGDGIDDITANHSIRIIVDSQTILDRDL